MENIIKKFKEFKKDKDESRIYDEIFDFVDGDLTRGELLSVFEWLEKNHEKAWRYDELCK